MMQQTRRTPLGEPDRLRPAMTGADHRHQGSGWFATSLVFGLLGIVFTILSFTATGFLATHTFFSSGPVLPAATSSSSSPAASPSVAAAATATATRQK